MRQAGIGEFEKMSKKSERLLILLTRVSDDFKSESITTLLNEAITGLEKYQVGPSNRVSILHTIVREAIVPARIANKYWCKSAENFVDSIVPRHWDPISSPTSWLLLS